MIQYMTAREAAEKWNISHRRVSLLCSENRIPDAAMLGKMWIIPRDAEKPVDARLKRGAAAGSGKAHPFIKWAGGKGQSVNTLMDNLPAGFGTIIKKYAEPFVGGGALLFAILNEYDLDEVYISDSNAELINAFAVIKDDCSALVETLRNIQNEYDSFNDEERQSYYYIKRDIFNGIGLSETTAVTKAALFIFLNKTCFNGLYRVNKASKFNVPAGRYKDPLICDSENLFCISERLQNVTIYCGDYRGVQTFADENTFIYFDPPYRPLNGTSGFTSYTEAPFGDGEQTELAAFYRQLSERGVKLMLSNSDPHNSDPEDNFFDDLYSGFNIRRIEAARMINSKADKRGNITELLITNY